MLMFSLRGVNLTIHTLGIRGCLTSTISKQTQHAKMVNKSNANMGRFHHPWIPYKNNDNISLSKKTTKTTQWKASAEITRILRALQRCITGNALFKFHHQHPFFVSPVNRLVISIQIILKWLKPFECQPKISYNLRKIPIFVSKNLTLVCCLSAQFASHPFPPPYPKKVTRVLGLAPARWRCVREGSGDPSNLRWWPTRSEGVELCGEPTKSKWDDWSNRQLPDRIPMGIYQHLPRGAK